MKIRDLALYFLIFSIFGAPGCTVAYKNGQQCKQLMIERYPTESPVLSFAPMEFPRAAIHGSRVVVEAIYRIPTPDFLRDKVKVKTMELPAAVECTFDGEKMETFKWLSSPTLAKTNKEEDQ